jgi:pimeloyl-ACP methyl ester carboxylesterase
MPKKSVQDNRDGSCFMFPMTNLETQTRFIEANGLKFETIVAGAGGSKFALLLHGFPESNISWRFQVPLLVSLGYEVWAPNLRGYGHSSRPLGIEAYQLRHLIADVAGLIDVGAIGRPVMLIAHDWGAIIAWAFAADQVRPLDKLVIMNVPHPARMGEGLRTWAQIKKSWYVYFFQLPWLPETLMGQRDAAVIKRVFYDMAVDKSNFTPDILEAYRANAALPGALTAMINYYRAATRGTDFARYRREIVQAIKTPTLMIWGEADTALGVELTDNYEGLVTDLTLKRLPQVSHWVQQEAPDKVNAILESWLNAAS